MPKGVDGWAPGGAAGGATLPLSHRAPRLGRNGPSSSKLLPLDTVNISSNKGGKIVVVVVVVVGGTIGRVVR